MPIHFGAHGIEKIWKKTEKFLLARGSDSEALGEMFFVIIFLTRIRSTITWDGKKNNGNGYLKGTIMVRGDAERSQISFLFFIF